jgi:hypothetical protein
MSSSPDQSLTEDKLPQLRQEALDHLDKALGILDRIDHHLPAAYVEQARCILIDAMG